MDLLEKGVSLETVSILLGHQNLKITQKHYFPWVKTRQAALDKEVSEALSGDPRSNLSTVELEPFRNPHKH